MKRKYSAKRIFAVMLSFVLLIGATACGNNSGQSEGGQDTIGQIESSSGKDSIADLDSEPVAEEPGAEEETESNGSSAYLRITLAFYAIVGYTIHNYTDKGYGEYETNVCPYKSPTILSC